MLSVVEDVSLTGLVGGVPLGGAAGGVVVHAPRSPLGSTDSGLMATEAGGLRATGGPFGKRSG